MAAVASAARVLVAIHAGVMAVGGRLIVVRMTPEAIEGREARRLIVTISAPRPTAPMGPAVDGEVLGVVLGEAALPVRGPVAGRAGRGESRLRVVRVRRGVVIVDRHPARHSQSR